MIWRCQRLFTTSLSSCYLHSLPCRTRIIRKFWILLLLKPQESILITWQCSIARHKPTPLASQCSLQGTNLHPLPLTVHCKAQTHTPYLSLFTARLKLTLLSSHCSLHGTNPHSLPLTVHCTAQTHTFCLSMFIARHKSTLLTWHFNSRQGPK